MLGLAYFDGNNDGLFYDDSLGFGAPPVADMVSNPLGYPNLFANNEEVGNLVRTTITTPFLPQQGARIEDHIDHLPMPGGTNPRYPSFTPPSAFGAWAGGFTPNAALQQPELDLLKDYGKVFFYEVEVFEGAAFLGTYYMHPDIQTLPQGTSKNWHIVPNASGTAQLQGNLPFGSFNLHYYTNGSMSPTVYNPNIGSTGNKCNSFELVFDAPKMHQYTIAGSVPKTITMDFMQHHQTFWWHSALSLVVN